MGLSPAQVGGLSLWQFLQCVRGYEEMHGLGEARMDDATFADLSAVLDAYDANRGAEA